MEKMAYFNTGQKGEKLAAIGKLLLACSAPWLLTGDEISWKNSSRLFELCPKLKVTFDILKSIYDQPDKGEKVIIFANMIQVQNSLAFLINDWLQNVYGKRIPIEVYNGLSGDSRHEILERFKDAFGFKVLIISPRVGGAGLNIAYSNHVIHYTREWNPALESQATDRVYRIGQKREVHVYYPTTIGNGDYQTAEEKLANILRKKREVIDDFTISTVDLDIGLDTFEDAKVDASRDVSIKFNDLPSLSASEFEAFVALLYERQGFKSKLLGKAGDNGADIECLSDNKHLLIQVKQRQTSTQTYGTTPINQIRGADTYYQHLNGRVYNLLVVTNGVFSSSAYHLAKQGSSVQLIDGGELSSMMSRLKLTLADIDLKLKD